MTERKKKPKPKPKAEPKAQTAIAKPAKPPGRGAANKRTQAEVLAMLRTTKGCVYIAARQLGISAQTIYNYRDRWPALAELMKHERQEMIDVAELGLYDLILAKDRGAIFYTLSTLGRTRGYVQRQEHAGPDGQPISLIEVIVPAAPAGSDNAANSGSHQI